jgi:hypothetical protein
MLQTSTASAIGDNPEESWSVKRLKRNNGWGAHTMWDC